MLSESRKYLCQITLGTINFQSNMKLADLVLPWYISLNLQQNNFPFSLEIQRTNFLFFYGCLSHPNLKPPLVRHLLPLNLQSFFGASSFWCDVSGFCFVLQYNFQRTSGSGSEPGRILILWGGFSCSNGLGVTKVVSVTSKPWNVINL